MQLEIEQQSRAHSKMRRVSRGARPGAAALRRWVAMADSSRARLRRRRLKSPRPRPPQRLPVQAAAESRRLRATHRFCWRPARRSVRLNTHVAGARSLRTQRACRAQDCNEVPVLRMGSRPCVGAFWADQAALLAIVRRRALAHDEGSINAELHAGVRTFLVLNIGTSWLSAHWIYGFGSYRSPASR